MAWPKWPCRRKAVMSTRERLFLSPIEKLIKYGVIPYKALLNLALVILVTSQVIIINEQESSYLQAASRNWYYYFFPGDYDFSSPVTYSFTINDTVTTVARAVSNYYSLNDQSPDTFDYDWLPADSTSSQPGLILQPASPNLVVTSMSNWQSLLNPNAPAEQPVTQTLSYVLNATSLGPLDGSYTSVLQPFFRSLVHMELRLPPIHNFAFGSIYRNCFRWSITVHFDFADRGNLRLYQDQNIIDSCDVYPSTTEALGDKLLWMNFLVIGLSVVHSSLLIRAMARSVRLLRRLTRWAEEQSGMLAAAAEEARQQEADAEPDDAEAASTMGSINSNGVSPGKSKRIPGTAAGVQLTDMKSPRPKPALGVAPPTPATAPVAHKTMRIDFRSDIDLDGAGDILITAIPQAAGAETVASQSGVAQTHSRQPHHLKQHTIVFAPGDMTASGVVDAAGMVITGAASAAGTQTSRNRLVKRSSSASSSEGGGVTLKAGARGDYQRLGGDDEAAPGAPLGDIGLGGGAAGEGVRGETEAWAQDPQQRRHYLEAASAAAAALNVTWSNMSWRDRTRFVNGWAVLSLAADACNVVSCAWNLSWRGAHVPSDSSPTHGLLMAAGAALLWLGVLRYLEHERAYFNIVLTLRRAGPRVLRFLAGCLPIFISYALFATLMFGDRVPRFANLQTSFITLFANLNGDVVRETMMSIVSYHPIIGQIYFYSFITLHIYCVLNIVIALAEESYFLTVAKTQEMAARLAADKAALDATAIIPPPLDPSPEGDNDQDRDTGSSSGSDGASNAQQDDPSARLQVAASHNPLGELHTRGSGAPHQPTASPPVPAPVLSLPQATPASGGPASAARSAVSGYSPAAGSGKHSRTGAPRSATSLSRPSPGAAPGHSVPHTISSLSRRSPAASLAGDARSVAADSLPDVLSALPAGINPLAMAPRPDAHSVKERPGSKLNALLRLAEWDETMTGVAVGKPSPAGSARHTPFYGMPDTPLSLAGGHAPAGTHSFGRPPVLPRTRTGSGLRRDSSAPGDTQDA